MMLRTAALVLIAASATAVAGTETHGIDLAGMDRSVKPGDDFFGYANGTWIKTHEIPADRASYGPGAILIDKTREQVKVLIQDAAKANPAHGSDAQKVGDYYASYLDQAAIDKIGLAPLKDGMAKIAAIKDKASLSSYLGSTLRADVDALNSTNFYTDHVFGVWITQAFEDPSHNVPYVLQGGLGMPDREYYLEQSPSMAKLRDAYKKHIANVLKLAGIADAPKKADAIFAFETKIAQTHATREASEDVHTANNPWKRADFAAQAPGMVWDAYWSAASMPQQNDFIVWHPGAVKGISALVASTPLDTWKDYLAFHLIDHQAGVLPHAFDDEHFAFYGTALSGVPKQRDRWKRAIDATNAALGEAVGKLYAAKHFPPSSKARIQAMVKDLIAAYRVRIAKLAWMSPKTKEKALAKLSTLYVGVGYPESWRDYSSFDVVRGDALGNADRSEMFEYKRNLAKLGGAVDRKEWSMVPQEVNAVNHPLGNALNFPAAILQAPYFDPKADDAYNFGSIGATIGHEISHSFDDQGSQFDAQGRLANWWTPEDLKHFEGAGAALAKQFDGYAPFPDLHVKGKQTLSENIADVAGLSAAHDAYLLSLHGKPAPVIDGLSGDQRFFLAFTQSWRNKTRDAALRQQIMTDGHAPAMYRGVTVRNLDAWYPAFDVKPGQKLYLAPKDRVQVW
ncbi:MAG: M13 family metallopeptidase [Alphaproteobacteria bacterium]|nr:M13 family metallopeptidase [Alphaproteobacteria bacterium]